MPGLTHTGGTVADPLAEPGWYRLTEHGWEAVDDEVAQAEFAAMTPGYQDLMYFETTAPVAQDPLF
jgi:hypothetical protein